MDERKITMVHGSGGSATSELINEIFAREYADRTLDEMEDAAVVPGAGTLAMTTDSFVVTPLQFRGGDIGRLCVCGTVNDLLMRGAIPKYLTCGFILEEGLSVETLKQLVHSMAETAREAGIRVVAGDTKVIEGNGGLYINTAGVGFVPDGVDIRAEKAAVGDAILVSGTLGDHHAAILSERMEIETDIESDAAPLRQMVDSLISSGLPIHSFRDVTRGGLGTVLKELAVASGKVFEIEEEKIPVTAKVQDFCGLLGLDPIYMGNEGKMVVILPAEYANQALEIMKSCRYGENAVQIGTVLAAAAGESAAGGESYNAGGELICKTAIGGRRRLDVLQGEGLPRIC